MEIDKSLDCRFYRLIDFLPASHEPDGLFLHCLVAMGCFNESNMTPPLIIPSLPVLQVKWYPLQGLQGTASQEEGPSFCPSQKHTQATDSEDHSVSLIYGF